MFATGADWAGSYDISFCRKKTRRKRRDAILLLAKPKVKDR